MPGPEDIRDIKDLVLIPAGLPPWALVLLALVAIAFTIFLWLRHRTRAAAATEPAPPPRPPHELALEALSLLERDPLSDPPAVKRFHFALSEIARRYVEGRYPIAASDMTTEEILEALPRVRELAADDAAALKDLLRRADLVKFTDFDPGAGESRELLGATRALVLRTKPMPVPPVPSAATTPAEAGP